MQTKRTTQELIIEAMVELLSQRELHRISVRDIADCAGVTSRSFYNHFIDKNDVVSRFYISAMTPYYDAGLTEWSQHRADLIVSHTSFFANALAYSGQNSILDTIVEIEQRKYIRHIRSDIAQDSFLMKEIRLGVNYMVGGQIMMLKEFLKGTPPVTNVEYERYFTNEWEMMKRFAPAVVTDNVSEMPVSEEAPE